MSADEQTGADRPENIPGGRALENEFRAMFAERSERVRVTTAPYAAVRQRIAAARRKRRLRIGSAGVAFAVAVVGIGVWATVPSAHHSAVAPTSKQPGSGTTVVYTDGHTEIPAGPLRDAALNWLRANHRGDLSGLTVVTTFDQGVQAATAATRPPGDAGVAVVDSRNGDVLALGGAWDRPLPIADLMKPIVLAAAFQTGHYTAESTEPLDTQKHPIHWPAGATQPLTYEGPGGEIRYWPPEPLTLPIHDVDITLVQAAENGYNGPFARLQLAADVTPAGVRDLAVRLGMPKGSPDLVAVPSLALGTAEATPLTMATVYATLTDGGIRRDPKMVGELLAPDGRVVWTPTATDTQVLSQNTAQQVADVLHAAMLGGPTGTGVEPGTTDDPSIGAMAAAPDTERSAWVDGADSHYVVSVGVSKTNPNGSLAPLGDNPQGGLLIGSRLAGPTWAAVVQAVRNRG